MEETTVTAMVLAAMPVGEYDRRLTLLTKEKGKIGVFAKGARKPTSALLACSQPFSFGRFTLFEGRSSYTVQQAEISNYFTELREDLAAVYYGMYFCEFAEFISKENLPAGEELKLLYQSLRALSKQSIGMGLVRSVYELKMLQLFGVTPQLYECVKCAKKEPTGLFSAAAGGMLCADCARISSDAIPVSESALYTMQYILATPVEKLYTFTVSEEVLAQLKQCMKRFLSVHIGQEMKSAAMLELL